VSWRVANAIDPHFRLPILTKFFPSKPNPPWQGLRLVLPCLTGAFLGRMPDNVLQLRHGFCPSCIEADSILRNQNTFASTILGYGSNMTSFVRIREGLMMDKYTCHNGDGQCALMNSMNVKPILLPAHFIQTLDAMARASRKSRCRSIPTRSPGQLLQGEFLERHTNGTAQALLSPS
jgi:hypothetical protein